MGERVSKRAFGRPRYDIAEMQFWTRDEYAAFAEAIKDDNRIYYAFEVLYWCGLRVGELLALTYEILISTNEPSRSTNPISGSKERII
jgi:integrase